MEFFFLLNLQVVFPLFHNILALANKSLIGFRVGFEFFGKGVQKHYKGEAFFNDIQTVSKGIPFKNFAEHNRASHKKQII